MARAIVGGVIAVFYGSYALTSTSWLGAVGYGIVFLVFALWCAVEWTEVWMDRNDEKGERA